MKVVVNTYEQLEEKEIELVHDGYKQTNITNNAVIFTKWVGGHKSEVELIPTFWNANKGGIDNV
jgi:hypothetical protein